MLTGIGGEMVVKQDEWHDCGRADHAGARDDEGDDYDYDGRDQAESRT